MKISLLIFIIISWVCFNSCKGQVYENSRSVEEHITPGAYSFDEYLPLIRNKKVAIVANQTSMVENSHLVDTLLSLGIKISVIFAPEHGFRGEKGPGDDVTSGIDPVTRVPLISLYGAAKKPTPDHLKGLDCIIFDIQDVGARFYTFISTLQYVMEACAENNVRIIVLDRPNPNGFYVDGPILEKEYKSFVGLSPIPVVHGLTIGEYALMANGERWLNEGVQCDLKIIKVKNYRHNLLYQLPVRPSPNLPDMNSIYLYPSLCFFEGTVISVGRGTEKPFSMIGFPGFTEGKIEFTPVEIPGVIKDPPYENILCKGIDLQDQVAMVIKEKKLNLDWLLKMYKAYPDKEKFFNNFFDKLAGNNLLKKQIQSGLSEAQIRASWEPALIEYKSKRKKYLLYPE
jgi:uncharacterized protein YbbC (DUF1343 family)